MTKNLIHDIKPSARVQKKKTGVKKKTTRKPRVKREAPIEEAPVVTSRVKKTRAPRDSKGRGVWFVAIVCIVAVAVGLSYLFTGAEIIITPQTLSVEIKETFSARKTTAGSGLVYDLVVVEGSMSENINIEEKQHVERAAKGKVTLYNNHNTKNQRLLIDTRLESSDGLIYKTLKEVVVPGQQLEDGDLTAGSIVVDVYADNVGEEYNMEEGDFKIKGFKGTPKYSTFSASVAEPLVGGFVGDESIVTEEQKEEVIKSLKEKLANDLTSRSEGSVPEGQIMYKKLAVEEFDDSEVVQNEDSSVTIQQSGRVYMFTFNKEHLVNYFVDTNLSGAEPGEVYIRNIETVNLDFVNKSIIERNPSKIQIVQFNLDDTLDIVFKVPSEALIFDLKGKKKNQFPTIIGGYDSIKSAELIIKPFWRGAIPAEREDITIINTVEG